MGVFSVSCPVCVCVCVCVCAWVQSVKVGQILSKAMQLSSFSQSFGLEKPKE